MILSRRVRIIQSVVKQHVVLAAVANVTNTNVYAVRVRIDVHVIINGFPVDPVIRAIRRSGFSTHPFQRDWAQDYFKVCKQMMKYNKHMGKSGRTFM